MSARASIHYASEYLTDVLLIEGVKIHGTKITIGEGATVAIRIDDDERLVDDLVECLTSLQRERRTQALRRSVERLKAKRDSASSAVEAARDVWVERKEAQEAADVEWSKARKELEALTAKDDA